METKEELKCRRVRGQWADAQPSNLIQKFLLVLTIAADGKLHIGLAEGEQFDNPERRCLAIVALWLGPVADELCMRREDIGQKPGEWFRPRTRTAGDPKSKSVNRSASEAFSEQSYDLGLLKEGFVKSIQLQVEEVSSCLPFEKLRRLEQLPLKAILAAVLAEVEGKGAMPSTFLGGSTKSVDLGGLPAPRFTQQD